MRFPLILATVLALTAACGGVQFGAGDAKAADACGAFAKVVVQTADNSITPEGGVKGLAEAAELAQAAFNFDDRYRQLAIDMRDLHDAVGTEEFRAAGERVQRDCEPVLKAG
jgi:hypothetical protein